MAKPSGAICNIDCTYCFYLEKEKLYPEKARGSWRMGDEELEAYVKQYIEANDVPVVNFAWQGGEPTLLGVDFYRKAVSLQKQYAGRKQITNAFQTNAILLDDEWGEFLAEEKFLMGVSIDGPEDIHNRYRVGRGGEPTWHNAMAGIEVLKKHKVEYNTLTVLHKHNADYPKELYQFLTREVGSHFLQFIPIVERVADKLPAHFLQLVGPEFRDGATVTEWSVGSEQYGRFLNGIFDQWVRKDIGQYFVQIFDTTLAGWMNQNPGLCIFAETCGDAMIIEYQLTQDFVTGLSGFASVHTQLDNQAGPEECGVASGSGSSNTIDFGSISNNCQNGQISCTGWMCGTSGAPPEDEPEVYNNVCDTLVLNPFVFSEDLRSFTMEAVEIVNESDRRVTLSFNGTQSDATVEPAPDCP